MELIFLKNLKNIKICGDIINHLLHLKCFNNSKRFIKEFDSIFMFDEKNRKSISIKFKSDCIELEKAPINRITKTRKLLTNSYKK